MFLKKDFEQLLLALLPEKFCYKGAFGSCRFIRHQDDKVLEISIAYREYFPHSAYVDGVNVGICFESVEKLLAQAYERTKIKTRFGETGTVNKSLVNMPGVDYSVLKTEIKDENSFERVAVQLNEMIDQGALPFFEKYKSLQEVLFHSEKMTIEDMSNFIGQSLPQRRMIIKKLCGDPEYEDYAQMVINYYSRENDPDKLIVRELFEILESM